MILRKHGASLKDTDNDYIVKMCEYAAAGRLENIEVLAENKVDVSMGDYDGRTPLHLAACNGKTSVIEYLLQQPSVIVNAVDRFGGTPYEDAIRHERKGAAAILEEAGGARRGDSTLEDIIRKQDVMKEASKKAARGPKIQHLVKNSQESSALRITIGKLSKEINEQRTNVEPVVQRMIWAIKNFDTRLTNNAGTIPFRDKAFIKASNHVLNLANELREIAFAGRAALDAEMGSEEGPVDCLIWKNATKVYKREAGTLDGQLRNFLVLARSIRRMIKEILKLCKRQNLVLAAKDSEKGN